VKAKLFDNNIVRGASISVDTFEGNVTLTGDKDMFQVLNMGSAVRCMPEREHIAPAKPSQKEKSQYEPGQSFYRESFSKLSFFF
jgi:hypothetical protein